MSEPKTVQFRSRARREGYTQLDNPVLRSKSLSAQSKVVWGLLCFFAREDESCYPGQERLALEVPCSERALRDYIAELAGVGLVEVVRRGLGLTNLYVLNDVDSLGATSPAADSADQDGNALPPGEADSAAPVRQDPPLPGSTKTQTTKTQKKKGGAGTPPLDGDQLPEWTFDGSDVPQAVRRMVLALHGLYCEETGQNLSAFRPSNGKPSEALTRITGAVLDNADLSLNDWLAVIRQQLANPWWDGPPSVGVIFGPGAVDPAIARWRSNGSKPPGSSVQSGVQTQPDGKYNDQVRW
jgi:hypothetical protein